MVYVLDTNIIVKYLRKEIKVHQNFNNAIIQGDDLVVPKIVDYEIKRGFRILSAPNKEAAYKVLTESAGWCGVADMDAGSWECAENIYADLYQKGLTIGEIDILIAAFCLKNYYTLVTNNTRHFKDIDGLLLTDWS